ncbi:MAG: MarR family transcriptional regulator [Actinobacteria bacterium]|nr:MarR family transcriptional regulator [Actinomycetota bacterium]
MTSQILIPQQFAVDAFIALVRANATATRGLSAELVEEHGLTINDFEALLRLSRAEDGRMRRIDLSRAILLTPSGVTRMLEGLERAGLVAKATCASDARVTYAVLTPAGKKKLKEASRSHVASIKALFGTHYSDEELETLARLLSRLDTETDDDEDCQAE